MTFLDRYCQAVFDHSFSLQVQRDLLRCIINSYRMADMFVKPLHYAEANYLRGHKRRADIESELRSVAVRYPEVEARIELNRTLSAYYTVLSVGRVHLTQSRANNPYQMIQHAIFRQELAAEAQLDLFLPPAPTPVPIDQLLFALLLHGYDKSDKSKPAFVHVVFPDHLCQFYMAHINLLARFPEIAAEMVLTTQDTTEEEPQVAIRREKKNPAQSRREECMKPGTPGFVGARLREAREARWLTATSLADLLGVTRAAVSQYENDVQSPRPDVMKRICDCLNLPLHFFLRPLKEFPKTISFYRSMSAATKSARIRAEKRREWLRDIVLYLTEYVVLPTLKFPMFDLPNDPKLISDHDIESIAANARKFWKLSNVPISNVVRLLENNGAIVARDYFEVKTLDAFSLWDGLDNTPYVILGADKGSACRSRTDIGHEIGHLLLHRNIKSTTLNKKADFDLIEQQAFKFSGAFHLPAEEFSDDFYSVSLDALRALQYKWKVSLGLMIERSRDLELISEEQRQRLWININRRGWRIKEPLDDEIEVERPLLLRKSFDLLLSEGIQNKETILEKLPYSPSDIETLTEFSLGSLVDQEPSLTIKSSLKRPEETNAIANGKILQFKKSRELDN